MPGAYAGADWAAECAVDGRTAGDGPDDRAITSRDSVSVLGGVEKDYSNLHKGCEK